MVLWRTHCLSCGDVLTEGDGKLVCRRELENVQGVEKERYRCRHCDQRLRLLTSQDLCYDCYVRFISDQVFLDQNYALFYYEGVVKDLYLALKFEAKKAALEDLYWIAEKRASNWQKRLPEVDVVIPLPSYWWVVWKRGFSSVKVFWRRFFPHMKEDILVRKRGKWQQKRLRRQDRKDLIRGQFEIRKPSEIVEKRVLLLDDVYTTGSTVEEVARVLKENGAYVVYSLVLFRDKFSGI